MFAQKISGPAMLGFADAFEGETEIGGKKVDIKKAPPKKLGPGGKPAAKAGKSGPGKMSGLPRNKTVDAHGKTIAKARVTAKRAVTAVSRAAKALKKAPATLPQKVLLGATAGGKKLTPKAQAAVRKLEAAVAKSRKLGGVLVSHAKAARTSAVKLAKQTQEQRRVAKMLRRPKGGSKTTLGELAPDLLEEYYTAIGAAPDPNNPGLLDDGSPDPAATPTEDAGMDAGMSMDLSAPDPLDAPELPPAPPMDVYIPDYEKVGGILYDGSKGYPLGYCGSYGLMYRLTDIDSGAPRTAGIDPVAHYGYVYGRYNDEGPERGIPYGDKLPAGAWIHVHGRYILGKFSAGAGSTGRETGAEPVDPSVAWASYKQNNPNGVSYGPLVGNPAMADFKGMRFDAQGRQFWLPQEAPEWLTFPLKQAAALTAQAEAKAAADAAKVEAAAQAKEAADAAAEQARQEAANALAESQAASEARVQETQQATQTKQQEVQAQQEVLEAAKLEREQMAAEASQEKEAGELLLAQAKRRAAYLQANPEAEFGPTPGSDDEEAPAVEHDEGMDQADYGDDVDGDYEEQE